MLNLKSTTWFWVAGSSNSCTKIFKLIWDFFKKNFIIKLPPFLPLWPIVLVARQATREASLTYVHIIIQRVCMQKFNSSFILHSYLFNGSNRVINMLFEISTRVLCLDVYILTKFHQHSFFYLWLLTEIYWLKGSDSHKIQCVIVYIVEILSKSILELLTS